jgi:fluoroacetyl-CoA thioesterase
MLPIDLNTVKTHRYVVLPGDTAAFQGKQVHPVCSTFVLAREVEWTTRLFVLDLCEADEEGVGTHVSIDHKNPAFIGEEIIFTARIESLAGNLLMCGYEAKAGDRVIATGRTGQRVLKRGKIDQLFGGSPQSTVHGSR